MATVDEASLKGSVPTDELPQGDRFFQDALHLVSLTHCHRFYFPRALSVLAAMWKWISEESPDVAHANALRFVLTSMLDRNLTIRNRFVVNKHNPRGRINGPLQLTLYVPGLSVEQNPIVALRYKLKDALAAFEVPRWNTIVSTQSLAGMAITENSLDYVFIDPPFGQNIKYSELNFLCESWLGVKTNSSPEAVVSDSQNKDVFAYEGLMSASLKTLFNALKPGRWMTVEFHNSQRSVWHAIHNAIQQAGFVIADVRVLDKQKKTINQEFYTSGSVDKDLAISCYKPPHKFRQEFEILKGTAEGAKRFIESHLSIWVCPPFQEEPEHIPRRLGSSPPLCTRPPWTAGLSSLASARKTKTSRCEFRWHKLAGSRGATTAPTSRWRTGSGTGLRNVTPTWSH